MTLIPIPHIRTIWPDEHEPAYYDGPDGEEIHIWFQTPGHLIGSCDGQLHLFLIEKGADGPKTTSLLSIGKKAYSWELLEKESKPVGYEDHATAEQAWLTFCDIAPDYCSDAEERAALKSFCYIQASLYHEAARLSCRDDTMKTSSVSVPEMWQVNELGDGYGTISRRLCSYYAGYPQGMREKPLAEGINGTDAYRIHFTGFGTILISLHDDWILSSGDEMTTVPNLASDSLEDAVAGAFHAVIRPALEEKMSGHEKLAFQPVFRRIADGWTCERRLKEGFLTPVGMNET